MSAVATMRQAYFEALERARAHKRLPVLAIYAHPADMPEVPAVVRLFDGDQPTTHVWLFSNLETARRAIPPTLVRMPRHPEDPRSVVESWL